MNKEEDDGKAAWTIGFGCGYIGAARMSQGDYCVAAGNTGWAISIWSTKPRISICRYICGRRQAVKREGKVDALDNNSPGGSGLTIKYNHPVGAREGNAHPPPRSPQALSGRARGTKFEGVVFTLG